MTVTDLPKFAAWQTDNLVRFAEEAYVRLKLQEEAIEQLRLDLRDAMDKVRATYNKDDWK